MGRRLPYPGLRPFRRDEADLFFGRQDAVMTMLDRLLEKRLLGVLGASGSGKSSLVRTGVFEALDGGYTPSGSKWVIADCRPGGEPIARLARALDSVSQKERVPGSAEFLERELRRGPLSIVEWTRQGNLKPGWQLLILVDQFEELFNYGSLAAREDADAYAALLVESAKSEDAPIYVVVTMRSDYFGACGAHPALAAKISDGIFLTPRMSRDACAEAIVGPSDVIGFEIDDDLVEELLNDMERFAPFEGGGLGQPARAGRQADQLPLMQYALNRMWLSASPKQGKVHLTRDDYIKIERLEGALDKHGHRVIDDLGLGEVPVERFFRALVRGPSVALATRDPRRLGQVADIAQLDMATAKRIATEFSREDCLFLRVDQPIDEESWVDINHESLIRQWKKLSEWLRNESEAAESWRDLVRGMRAWRNSGEHEDALLAGLPLTNAREWWDREAPRAEWTRRYTPDEPVAVDDVEAFIQASERHRAAEARAEAAQRRRLQWASGGAVAALLALVSYGGYSTVSSAKTRELAAQQRAFAALAQQDREREQKERVAELNLRLQRKEAGLREAFLVADKARLEAQRQQQLALAAARTAKAETVRAQSAERRAVAAQEATLAAFQGQLAQIDRQRNTPNVATLNVLGDYFQLASLVEGTTEEPTDTEAALMGLGERDSPSAGNERRTRDPLRARLRLKLAEALAESTGLELGGPLVTTAMLRYAEGARRLSPDPVIAAQSYLVEGQAEEMRDNPAEAEMAYRRAIEAAGRVSDDGRDTIILAASTRLASLAGQRNEVSGDGTGLALCQLPDLNGGRPDPVIQECARMSADIAYRDRSGSEEQVAARRQEAAARLKAIDDQLEQAAGEEGDLTQLSAPQLKLKVLTALVRRREEEEPYKDDGLIEATEKLYQRNETVEEAADLYSALLQSEDKLVEAFNVRAPFLESETTTARFMRNSEDLIRRLVMEWESGDAELELPKLAPNIATPSGSAQYQSDRESLRDAIRWAPRFNAMMAALARMPRAASLAAGAAPSREDVAAKVRDLFRDHVDSIGKAFSALANYEHLREDLSLSPRVHLSKDDRERAAELERLRDELAYACDSMQADTRLLCGGRLESVTELLRPLAERQEEALLGSKPASDADLDSGYWWNGYDPVAYHRLGRPARGRHDLESQLRPDGKTILFTSESNRTEYEAEPARFQPAFRGFAAEWLAVGQVMPGNPRLYCLVGEGGRLLLFATETERRSWCGGEGRTAATPGRLALADKAWSAIAAQARGPQALAGWRPKFSAPVASTEFTDSADGRVRTYVVAPRAPVHAPAGGRIVRYPIGLRIQHGTGFSSILTVSDAEVKPGQFVAAGELLGYGPEPAEGPAKVVWRLAIGSAPPGPATAQATPDIRSLLRD